MGVNGESEVQNFPTGQLPIRVLQSRYQRVWVLITPWLRYGGTGMELFHSSLTAKIPKTASSPAPLTSKLSPTDGAKLPSG